MLKTVFKESSVLFAFVILGALLLISVWLTDSLNQSILAEFKEVKVSVVVPPEKIETFRTWADNESSVSRYEIASASTNKESLALAYPELKSLIQDLDLRFFPSTALITAKDATSMLDSLSKAGFVERQVIHQPPQALVTLMTWLSGVFLGLWAMTLVLVLYFNIERLTVQEEPRWSLFKMLGEKPLRIFMPLWLGQSARVGLASLLAMGLAFLVSRNLDSFMAWESLDLSWMIGLAFFGLSLLITFVVSLGLFQSRFRRISLG
jgi:hypothetical protein